MRVICDAAVLIGLAKTGKLDLLEKLYEKIYIPWGVYNEVVVRGRRRPGAKEIDQANQQPACSSGRWYWGGSKNENETRNFNPVPLFTS